MNAGFILMSYPSIHHILYTYVFCFDKSYMSHSSPKGVFWKWKQLQRFLLLLLFLQMHTCDIMFLEYKLWWQLQELVRIQNMFSHFFLFSLILKNTKLFQNEEQLGPCFMSHRFCWHLNNVIPSIVQCMMHLHCSAIFNLELWSVASSLWLFIFMIRDGSADVVCSPWVLLFFSFIYLWAVGAHVYD